AKRGHSRATAKLPRGPRVEMDSRDSLACRGDLDAELERERVAERRRGQVDLRHLLADRRRQIRDLKAHRMAAHQPEPLEHKRAYPTAQAQFTGHPAVWYREVTAEESGRDALTHGRQVAGESAEVEDVVVDRRRG